MVLMSDASGFYKLCDRLSLIWSLSRLVKSIILLKFIFASFENSFDEIFSRIYSSKNLFRLGDFNLCPVETIAYVTRAIYWWFSFPLTSYSAYENSSIKFLPTGVAFSWIMQQPSKYMSVLSTSSLFFPIDVFNFSMNYLFVIRNSSSLV